MAEKKGKIVDYHHSNRVGTIRSVDGGPTARFYLPSVSNPEPLPKAGDTVVFDAPEVRKNKRGKMVQDDATSVTIEERAPDPPPQKKVKPRKAKGKGRDQRRGRRSDGKPGERRGKAERKPGERRPRADAKDNRRGRQGDKRKTDVKRKRPTANAKFPLARDVHRGVIHPTLTNPALVLDKYIQWPKNTAPRKVNTEKPKEGAAEQCTVKQDTVQQDTVQQSTEKQSTEKQSTVAENTEQAKTEVKTEASQVKQESKQWAMEQRHQSFFLGKTLAPLYNNFERRALPWKGVKARWEKKLRLMRQRGCAVERGVIAIKSPFAVQTEEGHILGQYGLCLDRNYGFPKIPSAALREFLKTYLEETSERNNLAENIRMALFGDEQTPPLAVVFDAIPHRRLGPVKFERLPMSNPEWTEVSPQKAPEGIQDSEPSETESTQTESSESETAVTEPTETESSETKTESPETQVETNQTSEAVSESAPDDSTATAESAAPVEPKLPKHFALNPNLPAEFLVAVSLPRGENSEEVAKICLEFIQRAFSELNLKEQVAFQL